MRRMLANIPQTLEACLAAAVLKLAKIVIAEPTEVNLKTFVILYYSLTKARGDKNQPYAAVLNQFITIFKDAETYTNDNVLPKVALPLAQLYPHFAVSDRPFAN
eukprot:UN07538